jgi:hypothetical protein
MLKMPPDFAAPSRWWHRATAILIADLLWFCFMYPIVPRSMSAAALEALLPVPLILYVYAAARCLFWISERPWSLWIRRSVTTAAALGTGAGGIWMVAWVVVNTTAVYGYMSIRNL